MRDGDLVRDRADVKGDQITAPGRALRVDMPSMLLAAAASGALVYPLVQRRETDHGRTPAAALSAAALVTVALPTAALTLSARLPRRARA
ncbi:hypothetical protein OV450_4897 [Actinobacteria bacterium OV450]|nr:hypothetical protein OV450_4897 [Actinobacteria bacterium OV450]